MTLFETIQRIVRQEVGQRHDAGVTGAQDRRVYVRMGQPPTDIRLELQHNGLYPSYATAVERRYVSDKIGAFGDVGTVSGHDNLAQAIIMRLLTPKGEMASLGHPEYGSNLRQLMGRRNTETTRSLLRLHIIESLRLEPRIAEVRAVYIESDPHIQNLVNVRLEVRPVDEIETIIIGPFALEFES